MAIFRILKFVDGVPTQIDATNDSIAAKSYMVGGVSGTELTKAILDNLTGGTDASTLHHHDGRYFQESEHIDVSAGLADAGKPIVLNEDGKVDPSMLEAVISDHNDLTGIQGGAADDYFHLTSAQHADLTDGGDTTLHTHDGRYYTETETNTLLSGKASTADVIAAQADADQALANAATAQASADAAQADATQALADAAAAQADADAAQADATQALADAAAAQADATEALSDAAAAQADATEALSDAAAAQATADAAIPLTQKGANNGVATLDGGGKVPVSQLPNSIMEYKGLYDADTNTPTLIDGTGNTGDVYRVSIPGTHDFGAGDITFAVGDYAIYNGTTWEKADTTDSVVSVNGQTGVVSLDTDDVSEGATNKYFSDAAAQAATISQVITNGVTTKAPSEDAVFDALALKAADADVIKKNGSVAFTADQSLGGNGLTSVASIEAPTGVSLDIKDNGAGLQLLSADGNTGLYNGDGEFSVFSTGTAQVVAATEIKLSSPSIVVQTSNATEEVRINYEGDTNALGDTLIGGASVKVFQDLSMETKQINNLADPDLDQDAATKKYVDDAITASSGGTAAATTYDNSTSGLTATNVQTAIDEVEGRLQTAEADVVAAQADATQALADAAAAQSDADAAQADATQALSDAADAQATADAAIPATEKGAALGVATLDAGGKVPVSQLPSSIMEYKGVYNVATNTPTLVDGTGDTGDVYRVATGGSRDFGSGTISFEVGDYIIYNGTVWEKSDTTDAVASVNGFTGVVVLDTDDVSDASSTNKYFTVAAAKAAAVADAIADGVTDVAPSQNAVFDALALKVDLSRSYVAGEAIAAGDLVVARRDGSNNLRVYKASAAAADNADFNNNGKWEVEGIALGSASTSAAVTIQELGLITPVYDATPAATDIGKSVYLSAVNPGRAVFGTPPASVGDGAIYLGKIMNSSGAFVFRGSQLRAVN